MAEIVVPQFTFGFYYQEILESLLAFKRRNVPEHTDESAQDFMIQALRAFAVVGHMNNTVLDQVANESTLPTAKLAETVRNMLRLIGYELAGATPAQATIVLQLSEPRSVTTELVPENALIATVASPDTPTRLFEILDAISTERTDRLSAFFVVEDGAFTDRTTEANAGTLFATWASAVGGSSSREGDSILFCHNTVLFNEVRFVIGVAAVGIVGVWEYYDGNTSKERPDSVTDLGGSLEFNLETYLGTADRSGTPIRVVYDQSGAYADVFSAFVGGENIATVPSLMGQTTPSTTIADYTVGSAWERFITNDLVDETTGLTLSGDVEFTLPETQTKQWNATEINGVTGLWFRFRVISVSTPTSPTIGRVRIDTGIQYIKANAVQGQVQIDDPLGSSDGTANQRFQTSQDNIIDGTVAVFVEDVEWAVVENFLSSQPTDRHARAEKTTDDRALIVFGDGVAGAIPPIGVSNIRAEYRHGADLDGNVGALTITGDKAGMSYIARLYNPRGAVGWAIAEGSTPASLAKAKIAGPASLRNKGVAIGPDDVVLLTLAAAKDDSTILGVSRARAIEEGFGPKTIELVVVAAGGALASVSQLAALSTYFNGDDLASPPLPSRIVANQQVTAVNYTPRVIDIVVAVRGPVTTEQVETVLRRVVQPEAIDADGVTYLWAFGGRVATSRLESEIFGIGRRITDVDITIPASDIELEPRELPVIGTISVSIIAQS